MNFYELPDDLICRLIAMFTDSAHIEYISAPVNPLA